MNKKFFAIALALSGMVLATPAMAGIANVDGGKKNIKKAKVVEHIDQNWIEEGRHFNGGVGSSSATVSGSWQYDNLIDKSHHGGSLGTVTTSNPNSVISSMVNTGHNNIVAGREAYNASVGARREAGVNDGYTVSSHTEIVFDHSEKYGSTYKSKMDSQTFTYNDESSADCILIGDRDNASNLYAAQGVYTREDINDQYYHLMQDYLDIYKEITVYEVSCSGTVSPILLDLDGDGKIEASNGKYLPHNGDFKSQKAVMFDFYGNDFPIACEWVGANDGILCRPAKDGKINGTNLFGTANGYDNGYDEMASIDADQNGYLEGAELEGLMVWTDTNRNGYADKGEMKSVADYGITSISVNHDNYTSTFVRDGKTYKTFDWWPSVVDVRKIDVAYVKR